MTIVFGWKGNSKFNLTAYQRIVILSIFIILAYQIILMVIFAYYNNDFLWKAALIFSGGISAGGYILATKSLWQIEAYEKKYRQAVFDQYGVDIEDSSNRNIMTFYNENEKMILGQLDRTDKEKLADWLHDTITNINRYEKRPERPSWSESIDKEE